MEERSGSWAEMIDGGEVTRTRVLIAMRNWRDERFWGKTCVVEIFR